MDSNRVAQDFYDAHPDWICRDIDGAPNRQADKYVTCIGSPYYSEYLPEVMREIIERSHPDGFTDNSWAGLPRASICYCEHCKAQFQDYAGKALPPAHDWDDEAYRDWMRWNFQRRTDLWQFNNHVTREAGGQDCVWIGMIGGELLYNSTRFIDLQGILPEAAIVMLDHQRRNPYDGFEQNTEAGKRLHEVAGWDKLIPESMPQYQLGGPAFRLASMPPPEVRLWSSSGFAGGIQPWWHHIGSMHEDRRQYRTAEPIFRWHEANQDVLVNRTLRADVGIVWSQQNQDYFGRADAADKTMAPYRGAVKALNRAGIPYVPLHADDIAGAFERLERHHPAQYRRAQRRAGRGHRGFRRGRRLGDRHGRDLDREQYGDARGDFALGRALRRPPREGSHGGEDAHSHNLETHARHSYLRLAPEIRAGVYGSRDATAPARRRRAPPGPRRAGGGRHTALRRLPACRLGRWRRRGAGDLHPGFPDLPARNLLDARAEDRHPRDHRPRPRRRAASSSGSSPISTAALPATSLRACAAAGQRRALGDRRPRQGELSGTPRRHHRRTLSPGRSSRPPPQQPAAAVARAPAGSTTSSRSARSRCACGSAPLPRRTSISASPARRFRPGVTVTSWSSLSMASSTTR